MTRRRHGRRRGPTRLTLAVERVVAQRTAVGRVAGVADGVGEGGDEVGLGRPAPAPHRLDCDARHIQNGDRFPYWRYADIETEATIHFFVRSPMTTNLDPAAAPTAGSDSPHHRRRWLILAVLATAQLMVVLDSTIVNIALPAAQESLGFSDGDRQWAVTAYALAFGSLLLLGGRLADLFGRKRVFLVGLLGFAVASAIGGAAENFEVFIAARALQGVFGALLAPAALALLSTTFADGRERAKAFAIFGAIAGGGAAIGLLLGGVLTEYLSWRWCMFVNLAFAGVSFAAGLVLLRHTVAERRPQLDVIGTVLASSGLFALVYGFAQAEEHGWSDTTVRAFLAAGVGLVTAFVYSQTRVAHPLLPLRVPLDRNRGGSYLALFVLGIGMFGVFLFLTYYLQLNLGFSAIESGVAFLPLVVALAVVAQIGSLVLAKRVGPRWIIAPGMAISAVGLFLLTGLDTGSTYATGVLPGLLVFGAGIGLVFSSAMSTAVSGIAADDAGVASATVNTAQQVGGSIGTALLNTIAASAAADYAAANAPAPPPAGPVPEAVQAAMQLLAAEAAVHSFTTAFAWAAGVLVVGAVVCGALLRPEVPEVDDSVLVVHA